MMNYIRPLNRLHEEVNRMLCNTETGECRPVNTRYPLINVWEEADVLFLEAELPGLGLEDVEIFVSEGNHLTIRGERKEPTRENGTLHRQELGYGKFSRELHLPFDVDTDNVEAKLANGILTISLPKSEAVKPKRIEVKG